ncbi:MAG: flagellar protein FlaG [Spongiibacteraceae bacterium]
MLNEIVSSGIQPAVKAQETSSTAANAPKPDEAKPNSLAEQQVAAPKPQELQSAVSKLNDYVQNVQRTLSFSIEEGTGSTVVKVYDSETEELIRQIPAEETIKLAASIEDYHASLFIKEQA